MKRRALLGSMSILAALPSFISCKRVAQKDDAATLKTSEVTAAPSEDICAAVRGNGELVWAHFGAYARIFEDYGPITAAAGGSSASISIFLLESILLNPEVYQCGEKACSELETRGRVALLLKGIVAWLDALGNTEEITAARFFYEKISAIQLEGVSALAAVNPKEAANNLVILLQTEELRGVINPAILEMLLRPDNIKYHVEQVITGIKNFKSFTAETAEIFFRPGLVNFQTVARRFSRIANFLAGYGPFDAVAIQAFLNQCAGTTKGMAWDDIRNIKTSGGTCGGDLVAAITQYRTKLIPNENISPNRLNDEIGKKLPALVATGLLHDAESLKQFATSADNYLNGRPLNYNPTFAQTKIGYWGNEKHLARVAKNERQYTDMKAQKFHNMGPATWGEIIALSPAEPGLASAQYFLQNGEKSISLGGWPDLAPVQALRNLGCGKIIYVTREGEDSKFAQQVAERMGMTAEDKLNLYSLDNPASSLSLAIKEADGVLCSNWNSFSGTKVKEMTVESYRARIFGKTPPTLSGSTASGPPPTGC